MGIFYGEFTSFGWLAGLDTALWASYLAAYLSRDALPPIDGASVLQRTDSQSRRYIRILSTQHHQPDSHFSASYNTELS